MINFIECDEFPHEEFLRHVRPNDTGDSMPCAVLTNYEGKPNLHHWPRLGEGYNTYVAIVTRGQRGAYFTPATFHPNPDGRRQRLKKNVLSIRAFWLDLEGPNKADGHASQEACISELERFYGVTGLLPTMIVLTGSGGMHAYFVLDKELAPNEWQERAEALVTLSARHGLKIDAPITTDAARIMRMPGSIHQKTGVTVKAYCTGPTYSLEELDRLLGYAPGAKHERQRTGANHTVNADLGKELSHGPHKHRAFSALETAKHCAALRMAMADQGEKTPYQPWLLALRTAALSVEGAALGHAISQGHPDYDPAEVDQKMESLTGGPPYCETWHRAWGSQSPCPQCLFGRICK